ncbi:formate dehydrogenase accessory sulfurtransferase FdhD [Peristeroidobacter agariperforans]|uniref:formate dehydrogenase accessory sulfurtransferase FdhD n=1 Tax=Peristeroidobacter agariperforans TaxID=268404 RepID=UPI00101B60AE|nr:formate dehydrogenase accessory sulfurtransferase FdhD [Peristeroidobacter agariperforans]
MLERSSTPATSCEVTVHRWRDGDVERVADHVAEELPVALVFNGVPHVVMLATPANLEDLAVGFTLSENIVDSPKEIVSVEASTRDDGTLEVRIGITASKLSELLRRQRNMTGRTGCGLCGAQTVEDAIRQPAPVQGGVKVDARSLHDALRDLRDRQEINLRTGSVHAAAWVLPESGIKLVREDVGRHNALDKVIGAVIRAGGDFSYGYFVVTSRASYEMVQKAVTVGGTLLAAVSAPTAFAIRMAEAAGLTLIGFAREHQHVVYAHPSRLLCTSTT